MKTKPILPKDFYCSSTHCGIKKNNALDLALLYSSSPAIAAAVYTQNKIQAAPLFITKQHLKNSKAQAILINSGNANACTGKQGKQDARDCTICVGKLMDIDANNILAASTGVIGVQLPLRKVLQGIKTLCSNPLDINLKKCAQAIMTTDTFPKIASKRLKIGGKNVTITGIAKGSGMIAPHMATMLGFILTDADINPELLQNVLREAVDSSFNMITVDGDCSTNDMVIAMTNGSAGNKRMVHQSADFKNFKTEFQNILISLAKMIAQDGEGATKLIEINVENAKNKTDAKKIALSIANSNLVKTAVFGNDPNWGRILCAAGYATAAFSEEKCELYLGNIKVFSKGTPLNKNLNRAKRVLKNKRVTIRLKVNLGSASTTSWTCDLTYEYIRSNAEYTT